MRRLPRLLATTAILMASHAQSADTPYYRYGGKQPEGAASPAASGNSASPSASPAFTASPATASYQPGGPVTVSPPATSGTTASTTYALVQGGSDIGGTLPTRCTGLSFASGTGVISGTPTGYCSLTGLAYQAITPGKPNVVSDTFDITVRSAYAVATQPAPVSLRAGAAKATSATVSGSPYGTLAWSVQPSPSDASGVPAWIAKTPGSCDSSSLTCQVTAAPSAAVTPGTYPASGGYAIRAVDSSGTTVTSQGFNVVVQPAQVAVPQATQAYTTAKGASQTTSGISPTGGTLPYAYSLVTASGTAPANAAVNQSTGAVTYTADAGSVGTWTYRVRATSAGDASNYADGALNTVTVTAPTSTVPRPTTYSLVTSSSVFGSQSNVISALYDGSDSTGVSVNLNQVGKPYFTMGWGGSSYKVTCLAGRVSSSTKSTIVVVQITYPGGKTYSTSVSAPPGGGDFLFDASYDNYNNGNMAVSFEGYRATTDNATVNISDFRAGTMQGGSCVTP